MPIPKLEEGKYYLDGHGNLIHIEMHIKITEERTVFYDQKNFVYESDGRFESVRDEPDHKHHLISEATIIPTNYYNQLVAAASPKRWRKIVVLCSSSVTIGIILGIFNFFIINHYCGI